jgi:hypothetical protein
MPTPRKPASIHALNGTFRQNRHGASPDRVEPMNPDPPESMDAECIPAWVELVGTCRPYLAQSDRAVVEIAARLLTASRRGELKAAQETVLLNLLGKIGATPEGRARLHPINAGVPAPNPFDEFKDFDR